jgi:hypothetical protein
MHLYIVFGILLIVPTVDFALAAPVLVQEKRQLEACADMANIPECPVTVLGKRGEIEEVGGKYIENWFAKPEESSAALPSSSSPPSESNHGQVDVNQPLPSVSEGWSLVSSLDHAPPPNPRLSTESDHELTGVHAPLSSAVFPTWFLTDHGYMGPHAPSTEFDSDNMLAVEEPPSRPASPTTEFNTDDEYQVVHPPPPLPGTASLTESDHEMVDVPPSSPVSSTNPDRRSMGADSRLENLQVVSDASKGNAKESHRISGTARDVLNAAQRELQRERSLDPGE